MFWRVAFVFFYGEFLVFGIVSVRVLVGRN